MGFQGFQDKISRIRRSFYESFIERTLFPGCFRFIWGLIGDNMRVIYIYTQYRHNRWVICREYTGDLPFTGYLPVVYGPLLSKCTEIFNQVLLRRKPMEAPGLEPPTLDCHMSWLNYCLGYLDWTAEYSQSMDWKILYECWPWDTAPASISLQPIADILCEFSSVPRGGSNDSSYPPRGANEKIT